MANRIMKLGKDVRTRPSQCTNCGEMLDGATVVGEGGAHKPKHGDISVCIYCEHVMGFTDDGRLRDLTGAEIVEAMGDKRLIVAQWAIKKAKESRR